MKTNMTGARIFQQHFFEIENSLDVVAVNEGIKKHTNSIKISTTESTLNKIVITSLPEIQSSKLPITSAVFSSIDLSNVFLLFIVISLLLLVSATLNYINISVAGVTRRMKEIGIRKVVGANRRQLIAQFISENIILITFSMILGLIICEFILFPGFGYYAPIGVMSIMDAGIFEILSFLIFVILFTGILAGLYPSIVASSFNPVQIFRHGKSKKSRNLLAQFSLLLQFVFATVMVIFSIAWFEQAAFIKNIDWGYDQDQMIVIPIAGEREYDLLKNQIHDNTSILGIAGSVNNLGMGRIFNIDVKINDVEFNTGKYEIGNGYFEATGLMLKQGKTFDAISSDGNGNSIIVNETFAAENKWDQPLGKIVFIDNRPAEVIGVVKDFHYEKFRIKIGPLMLMYANKNDYNFMSVKIKKGEVLSAHDMIQTSWEKLFPTTEFDAIMQDQVFVDYIRTTRGNYVIFMAISFMILGTSCMGLLGLISINLIKREKEIGIRKVIGASESKLLIMLSSSFVMNIAGLMVPMVKI